MLARVAVTERFSVVVGEIAATVVNMNEELVSCRVYCEGGVVIPIL